MKPRIVIAAATAVAFAGVFAFVQADNYAGVGAGYMAKIACSEIYLAKRDATKIIHGEFQNISPALEHVALKIDSDKRSVSASLYGLGRAEAVYREGYGCTLKRGALSALPELAPVEDKPIATAFSNTPQMRSGVDYAAVDAALEASFADNKAATRSILVVKDGAIIAERYADGFSAATPFLSWSMAKSVTATMVGAAVHHGFVDLNARAPVPEWAGDTKRAAVSWTDLLQMQSGLAFSEVYDDPTSDASQMLFRARDAGAVAAKQQLLHPPGSYWSYSSGTTNLIQRTLRETLEANDTGYHTFAHDMIFTPLGMASAVLEPDASGAFIGSSFMYATARDWAKLGQLYLDDGVVDGERLLPEGWSIYVSSPASASDGFYGAQFWLNRPGKEERPKYIPGVPDDAYLMAGHEGQYVLIVPDKRLVIIRTGMTRGTEPMPLVAPTFAAIYAAIQ
ncbi:MAG: serine hydrolase [Parvularculaceae bacterium]|nr:serine hydrolase [Parvularculaceae bacterium]